ncbi:MAG: MFS transporter [Candidatus Dormibacteraeota bacterium]|nr:MFS transporter [Candidatus Dormibacteraeota bacterium]
MRGEASPLEASWRHNLAALWFAQLTAIFGFSFAYPFLPLYLQELGIRQQSQLAFWTGLAGGASGLALAIMSPIWGVVADRFGRKSMLLRAMLGAALTVGLMGFARGPVDLVVLRMLQGASSGTVAAATALVASGTPRSRVGWALGVLASAIAVGSALGPVVGGLAAAAVGVRAVFWAGGGLLLLAALPVLVVVHEAPRTLTDAASGSALALLRDAAPGAVAAVIALIVCQALLQAAYVGFQPLVVLRLLQRLRTGTAAVTGLAFGAAGLASALAAVVYAAPARRFGYRRVAVVAALALGTAELFSDLGPGVAAIIAGATLAGAFYGTLGPAISTMIGLESPGAIQARIFGFSSSATALGFAIGPFGGGLLAAQADPSVATAACAAVALILAGVLFLRVREPRR